ncbi:hypothetical protein [Kozakia baliensis]|nr:hypothetical protein [Kozakia baliensis]
MVRRLVRKALLHPNSAMPTVMAMDRLVEQIANVDAGQTAGLTGLGEEMD